MPDRKTRTRAGAQRMTGKSAARAGGVHSAPMAASPSDPAPGAAGMAPGDLQAMVRRAAGRALAARGLERRPPAAGGVHVRVGEPERPAAGGSPPAAEEQVFVTARCLARVPDGGELPLDPGARVTPLARDEARRRGIRFTSLSAARGGKGLTVAVGSDHGGFELKGLVVRSLSELGHRALDLGAHDDNPTDYPDSARAVAEAVAEGRADLGVAIDGAGIGSAIAANKVPGARAACCCDEAAARNAREHNFANVLTLGGRTLAPEAAERVLRAFLATPEGAERHERRARKIADIEARYAHGARPLRRVLPGPKE